MTKKKERKRKERKKKKQASHHSCGSRGRHLFYFLHLPRGGECDELWIRILLVRNATAAERPRLQRSGPGFSLTVTQDGPQFRTQRLGQTSRRYSLSLRTIHSFSVHCAHPLASRLPIFLIFPSASPSCVCLSLLLSSRLPPHSPPSPFLLLHYHNDH